MTNTRTSDTDAAASGLRRRSIGRRIALTAYAVFTGVVVLALIAAGFGVWTVQRSFPQLSGEITAAGLTAEVEVLRDERGVPTIVADDTHDLFFGQGYVHAQDRFWEMDFRRHVTSGRLSELFGESQVPTDTFLRTLGWREVAEQEVALLDPVVLAYYEAYAEGVNAWIEQHGGADASLEYAVLGLQNADYVIEPWEPADSVAWLKAMAWDLRDNIGSETDRALLAQRLDPETIAGLYPGYPFEQNPVIVPTITDAPAPSDPEETAAPAAAPASAPSAAAAPTIEWTEVAGVVEAASALLGEAAEGVGSNSWVVSGDLTESGSPILANDPHLGAELPSVWYQVDLKCRQTSADCPFDVAGFSFSGMPGVILGHNDRIAWGFTNLTTDVTDLYLEKIQGDRYWRDGELVDMALRTETIEVAGGEDVDITVRATANGPVVSDASDEFTAIADDPSTGTAGVAAEPSAVPDGQWAVSLRWTALDPGTTASAVFALDTAQDFSQFRTAASLFDVPAQNLVYADVDGNIGYQTPGRLPVRGAGDGSFPQPGWDSAYAWTGDIPFGQLPTAYNPPEGYIVTANNAVVAADYPYFLTRDWDYGWRAARITDLLQRAAAAGELTVDSMRDIQADREFWMGKRLASAYADVRTGDDATDAALDLLGSWDAQNDPRSPAAAYANVLWDELARDMFVRGRDEPAPVTNQGRLFLLVDQLLDEPDSGWWINPELEVDGLDEMLARAATDATATLTRLQGDNAARWDWGSLHALDLRTGTFGSSGIAPIEWLFNRGPYPVGGGGSVVDATGWVIGEGFGTVTVPSLRMVVDLGDFDASRWNHLTGQSGHAFHPNYTDQIADWQNVQLSPWPFSLAAVTDAATHVLTLAPAS